MPRGWNGVILLTAAICGMLFLCHAELPALFSCPFKVITGFPCAGCGGTRAARLLIGGDLRGALWINPLSVLLCLWLAVSYVWIAVDVIRGRDTYWPLYKKRWNRWAVVVVVAALLANWGWNIVKEL